MSRGSGAVPVMLVIRHMNMGGAQRQLFNLAAGLDRSRFRPVVICLHREEPLLERLREHGVEATCIPARHSMDATLPLRLARRIRGGRIRLLHSYLFAANAWGRLAARLAGIPAVASERSDRATRRRREVLVERALARWTAAYVVNSDAVGRSVRRLLPSAADRIHTIHNGIDLGIFDLDREACRRRLRGAIGAGPGDVLAGVLGSLTPDKGHAFLLAAAAASDPGLQLVVIGEGPQRHALESQAVRLGLRDRVHLLGHRDDIAEVLTGLDVLVQCSLREGMPNAVLEGMAAGVPIIATRVGGTAEALDDGSCGLLVEPGAAEPLAGALRELRASPERGAALASRARRRVQEKFSLHGMLRQTEALYDRLLSGRWA